MSFALLQAGFWGSFAAAIVSAAALIVARPRGRRRGMLRAFAGLAIGLVVVGVLASVLRTAMALPPIHDITTDPEDPPEFQAIVPLRVDAPNPIDYPGAEVAAQREDSYPDIQPLLTERAPEEAFARALEAAGDLGWEVVAADRAEGRVEAVDTTNDGSRINVRSKSRVGVGDLGTNAARIRAYMEALSIRLAEA